MTTHKISGTITLPIGAGKTSAVPLHAREKWDRGQVRCVETGTIYDSAAQAAHSLGCTRSTMSNHLNGRFPHIRGKHFEYVQEGE